MASAGPGSSPRRRPRTDSSRAVSPARSPVRGRGYPYAVALPPGSRIDGVVPADPGKLPARAEREARFVEVAPPAVIADVTATRAAFLHRGCEQPCVISSCIAELSFDIKNAAA